MADNTFIMPRKPWRAAILLEFLPGYRYHVGHVTGILQIRKAGLSGVSPQRGGFSTRPSDNSTCLRQRRHSGCRAAEDRNFPAVGMCPKRWESGAALQLAGMTNNRNLGKAWFAEQIGCREEDTDKNGTML